MLKKLIVCSLFITVVTSLLAFDGQRKGFLLGGGIGMSRIDYRQEVEYEYNGETEKGKDYSENGIAAEFKIGYGASNKLELYFSHQATYFNLDAGYDSIIIANSASTLAASYFLSSQLDDGNWHPSAFVSGGLGISNWGEAYEEDQETAEGQSFFVGLGYEFSKHFRVSLNYFGTNPTISIFGADLTTYSNAILLTVSGLAF